MVSNGLQKSTEHGGDIMGMANLTIYNKIIGVIEDEGKENAENIYDEKFIEQVNPLEFTGEIDVEEIDFENGNLEITASIMINGLRVMDIMFDVKIDIETAMDIFSYYIGKLRKIEKISR